MKTLIARTREGDRQAADRLFQFLTERFFLIAKRRIGREDAEDISQEACLTVLEKLKTGPLPDNFEAWAYQVLRLKIGNLYQKREVRHRVLTDSPVGSELIAPQGAADPHLKMRLTDCLRRIIQAFPRYGRVLILVYQGYQTPEICGRLRIQPGNLYVMLNRGRALLSECLEKGDLR